MLAYSCFTMLCSFLLLLLLLLSHFSHVWLCATPKKAEAMAPHSSPLAWKISWTEEPGRLQSMGSPNSRTRLRDFTFTFHFHALEKEMATHSRILAWEVPWTAEPGGLQSLGSQKFIHNWSDWANEQVNSVVTNVSPESTACHKSLACYALWKTVQPFQSQSAAARFA